MLLKPAKLKQDHRNALLFDVGLPTATLEQGGSTQMRLTPESAESDEGIAKAVSEHQTVFEVQSQVLPSSSSTGFLLDTGHKAAHTQAVCLSIGVSIAVTSKAGVQEWGGLFASIFRGSKAVSFHRSTTANSCCARQLSPGFTTAGLPNLAFSTQQNFL